MVSVACLPNQYRPSKATFMTHSSTTVSSKNNTQSVLRFQLVLDAENIVIGTNSIGKIRANITGLQKNQISNIVECIKDAGPEAIDHLKKAGGGSLMAKMPEDYYEEYLERFKEKSDLDLIRSLNQEVGKPGWGPARIGYLTALYYEFKRRDIDPPSTGILRMISIRSRVSLYELNGKKFVLPID